MKAHHRTAGIVVSSIVLSLSAASAHDRSMHKGKAVEGTLSVVAPSSVRVKSDAGEISVDVSPETTVERDGELVSPAALHVGAHVLVFGPKLPGGAIAAREIVVHGEPTTEPPEPEVPAEH